jgi:hypothetical protein
MAYRKENPNFQRDSGCATQESAMNSTQRDVLAFSRVPVATIFVLNGIGIISRAVAAKEHCRRMFGGRYLRATGSGDIAGFPDSQHALGARVLAGDRYCCLYRATPQFPKNSSMAGGLLFIGATQSQPTLARASGPNDRKEERNERASFKFKLTA